MSDFTAAYLARLEVWGLGLALVQGAAILLSWRTWARATDGAAPSLRHALACAHFMALAVVPMLTLVVLHWSVTRQGDAAPLATSEGATSLSAAYRLALELARPAALVWAAGAGLMVLVLAAQACRIRRVACGPTSPCLQACVGRLAEGWLAGPAIRVRLADVAGPQVVGLWRPILLAPPRLASVLPPGQRDAVLLHELAHVRRADFRWNIVQRLVLAVLWFNPAAWVLYGHIAREREASCDEVAVRRGASPVALAQALVRLAEEGARPRLAMGLCTPSQLIERVERLLAREQPRPRLRQLAIALTLSAACLAGSAAGRLGLADPAMGDLGRASLLGPVLSIDARDRAGTFRLRVRRGRVLAATIGGSALPQSRIVQQGRRVILVGDRHEPVLALTVTPQGSIRWEGRG